MTTQVLATDAAKVREYHQTGFTIIREAFNADEIAALASEADTLLARSELIDTSNIRCRWADHVDTGECLFDCFDPVTDIGPVSRFIARHEAILAPLRAIYGEEPCLLKDKLIFKRPGAKGYALHQDYIGWKEFPESFVTVIVAIDPTDAQNGATEVFPGYHRQGYLSARDGDYHELSQDAIDPAAGVVLDLRPGDLAIFSGFTPHRSAPNNSPALAAAALPELQCGQRRRATARRALPPVSRLARREVCTVRPHGRVLSLTQLYGDLHMATIEHEPSKPAVGAVRFHLSLNVDDLTRSVEFFSLLFDVGPSKHLHDYAKFELEQPPLVLSLEPHRAARGGKLNHLGFRLASSEALVAMQHRLELHGVRSQREEGVECCYARQTKFWVTDPDGNLWEMYTLEDDLDHRGTGNVPRVPEQVVTLGPVPALWAHRLGEAIPKRILAETAGVDEVLLEGTFNAALPADVRQALLAEVARVLKPLGRVALYQLTARTSLGSLSTPLPGPAAMVEAVPSAEQLSAELAAAGFVDLYFEKLAEHPCLTADGVECRETRLIGYKPAEASPKRRTRCCTKVRWPRSWTTPDTASSAVAGRASTKPRAGSYIPDRWRSSSSSSAGWFPFWLASDARAEQCQLGIEPFVTPVEMIGAAHDGLAAGSQTRQDQRGTGAQVGGCHHRAGQRAYALDAGLHGVPLDASAQPVQLGHVSEAFGKDVVAQRARSLGDRGQSHELRLQVGGNARIGSRRELERSRPARSAGLDDVARRADNDSGRVQHFERGLHVCRVDATDGRRSASNRRGNQQRAGFDPVGNDAIRSAVQPIDAVDFERVACPGRISWPPVR